MSARTVKLGGGVSVPYPEPVNAAATKIGKANRRTDTKPEVRLRSALHQRGLRFRKDLLVRCGDVKVRPDIVFPRARVAVFVDGCFWHGCPEHQQIPRRNRDYWVPKLVANVERDRRVDTALTADDWTVVRIWEHQGVDAAANLVAEVVRRSLGERAG
jgi:DNA mismatch endonuclease (patch repair protein)